MTPDQEVELLSTVGRTGTKMDMLISNDGSRGQVPELKRDHQKLVLVVSNHSEQLSYWKGGLAVIGLLVIVFGGGLLAHILGGK